jgi:hypothetical protein
MVYFGSYNIRTNIQNPEDFIDSYNYIFKINTLSDTMLEIVDVMYMNTHYEYLNIDKIYNIFKECRIIPGMIIHYIDNDVYFTHPHGKLYKHIKMYEIYKDTKYIQLDDLEKIKTNMIKKDKILSS